MPSPVGHALGGAIVALLVAPARKRFDPTHPTHPTDLTYLTWCVVAGCLPDVDFLWGRHSMETHSLFVAGAVGLAVLAITRGRRLALACALAWASHVFFDWLGSDDSPPIGVMALWPLTANFYFADAFIFDAISRRYWLPGFLTQNIIAVLKEIALLAPPVILLWWWRTRAARATS